MAHFIFFGKTRPKVAQHLRAGFSIRVICVIRVLKSLEQSDHLARFQIEVHIVEDRTSGQARHRAHGADERVQEARAHTRADIADGDTETSRRTLDLRFVGEGEVRLRHADGQFVEAEPCIEFDLRLGLGRVVHAIRAVELGDGFDLVLDCGLNRI